VTARLRIGVTQRRSVTSVAGVARDSLDPEWASWFADAWPAVTYEPIPNFDRAESAAAFFAVERFDGFVLAGGNDIGASAERDATERALLQHARSGRAPVLGVCRGMQMLHVESGGYLVRRLGHVGVPHDVSACGVRMRVNSFHNFVIEQVQSGWQPLAAADDGTVEAMRHDHLPWLGVMWHPERAQGHTDLSQRWIAALFAAAGGRHR